MENSLASQVIVFRLQSVSPYQEPADHSITSWLS